MKRPKLPEPTGLAAILYEAELEAFHLGPPGKLAGMRRLQLTASDAHLYLDAVLADRWTQQTWPGLTARLVLTRPGVGAISYGDGRIELPRDFRSPIVVLHELAHRATRRRVRQLDLDPHGPEFAGAYLALLRRFVGAEAARRLRRELERRGMHPVDDLVCPPAEAVA
jgi:putative metallohydrolase (TIGR04338 family)